MKQTPTKICQSLTQDISDEVPADLKVYFDKVEELAHRMT